MAYDTFTLPFVPPFRLDLTVWALRELSINVANDKIDLTNLEELTNEEAIEFLSSLGGIGLWSVEYFHEAWEEWTFSQDMSSKGLISNDYFIRMKARPISGE